MSDLSRRAFLTRSSALGLGFAGLGSLWPARTARASLARSGPSRFGALIADPAKILDLPEGFTYSILSKAGATMDGRYIIFPPAHADHPLPPFALGAVDYLLKPIHAVRLGKALARARHRLGVEARRPRPSSCACR